MSTAESQPEPVTHQKPHPLEFYALGKVSNPPQMTTTFKPSMAFRGQSNDLLQRNALSINNHNFDDAKFYYKHYVGVTPHNTEPAMIPNCYRTYQKFNLPTNMTNKETYNLTKEKLFAQDRSSSLRSGHVLTKSDFLSQKKNLSIQTDMSLPSSSTVSKTQINGEEISEGKTRILKDKVFIHDKDNFPFRRGKDIPVADPTYIFIYITI